MQTILTRNKKNMLEITKNQPIILGLAGKAGSGKTSVAEQIVPKGSMELITSGLRWDHIFYALPLYELASIKNNIQGINSQSRKLYAIHEVIYNLYGGSPIGFVPDYNNLVSLVHQIESMPIGNDGLKPRSFLQESGDLFRSVRPSVFADWAIMKSVKSFRHYQNSLSEDESFVPFCMIISDVRYVNEAESILKHPNGVVICFDAEQKTLDSRLIKRDGQIMPKEQSIHPSENEIDDVKKISTAVVVTDNMTLEEQTESTIAIIKQLMEESNA